MFFENDILSFNILEVIELKQKNINIFNSGRNFSALSLRTCADTHLKTAKSEFYMQDYSVSYVPARVDYSRISAVDELIVIHFDITNYHAEDIEFFNPENPEVLLKLFREILECWNKREEGYKYKCTAILYEIFAECYRQNFKEDAKSSKIQKSVDYIDQNFKDKSLSVKKIAEQSFISEVYFRKLFKEEYGISPKQYIIKKRLQNAIGLISAGYYTLSEVADMSGYSDYKHFSVEFKKAVGVSPSEYSYNYRKN